MTSYNYLFGPVPSRRLGISLGVDLIPFKTCTLDCVYCESGKTTDLTCERKEYVSTADVKNELVDFLKDNPKLDFITFSGSGEPTLASNIGEIVDFIKDNYPQYKLALLTNGTLLFDDQLKKEIMRCDLIVPSLDAVSDEVFQKINRPNKKLNIEKEIQGLIDFSKDYSGEIWLEIFIVPSINDTKEELAKLKEVSTQINPEKVQINSLDRPGTEEWVQTEAEEKLLDIVEFFKPLPVEVISKKFRATFQLDNNNIEDVIINILQRRPCTAEDISRITNIEVVELEIKLKKLIMDKKVKTNQQQRGLFYQIV